MYNKYIDFFGINIDMSSYWVWFWVIFIPVILLMIIWTFPKIWAHRKIKDQSFRDSLMNGGIDEPDIVREMTDEEQKNHSHILRRQQIIATILLIIFSIASLVFINIYIQMKSSTAFISSLLVITVCFYMVWWLTKIYHYGYLDKRSPVFRVTGSYYLDDITHEKRGDTHSAIIYFTVRGIKLSHQVIFDNNEEPVTESGKVLKASSNGDILTVDYTPFLRYVLLVTK